MDFVYIDAAHDYNSVSNYVRVWTSKVRKGGIIAGHDYGKDNEFPGIYQFVNELINEGKKMYFTIDDVFENKNYQTWYFQNL